MFDLLSSPDAKVWMDLVYLKYCTRSLMRLMVYHKVLFHPMFSIYIYRKLSGPVLSQHDTCHTQGPITCNN